MNRENINTLKETFERLYHAPLPEYPYKGFNMVTDSFSDNQTCVMHGCGTAACIMGWQQVIFHKGRRLPDAILAEGLGVTTEDTYCLFYPSLGMGCSYISTPEIFTLPAAIRVLELLLEHGTMVNPEDGRNMWERAIAEQQQVIDRLEGNKPEIPKIDWIVELQKPDLTLAEGPVREPAQ